jgi:hypothetical protein
MRIPSGKLDQLIYFVAVDSTDLKTRETGLTTFTVYRSRNGGAATIYTTPTVAELSAANMPGVYSLTIDEDTTIAAGSDSEEYCVHITQAAMAPVTRTIELYRRDTTSGQTATVTSGGVTLADAVSHGGTLGSSTATLALSRLSVVSQSSNTAALTITGNGTGSGELITGGATGNGVTISAGATSGHGIIATATGTSFNGARLVGSPTTGEGLYVLGGSTSGAGFRITTTSGHAIHAVATGTTMHGIVATGGATTSDGIIATGGGVGMGIRAVGGGGAAAHGIQVTGGSASGNGINITTTSGHAISAVATGTTAHGIHAAGGATTSHGINALGGGVGHGILATSGSGATGDGLRAVAASTNGTGLQATGTGSGNGIKVDSVSGDAILTVVATSGHGATFAGTGTTKHGVNATGGATTSDGIRATGGGVGHGINAASGAGATGNAINAVAASTNGSGFVVTGTGTGNGLLATGGGGAGGDGIEAAAGGGVPIRGSITGDIIGTLSTLTTYTGNTVQTGDSFARLGAPAGATVSADIAAIEAQTDDIGAAGAGLTALGDVRLANLDATTSSRASQTSVNTIDDFLDTEIAAILAAVDTEVAAILALLDDARGEPAQGAPPVNPDAMTKIDYLYKQFRNRRTQTATTFSLYADDAVTVDQKSTVSDDGVTAVRGELASGP